MTGAAKRASALHGQIIAKNDERATHLKVITDIRDRLEAENRETTTGDEARAVRAARDAIRNLDGELRVLDTDLAEALTAAEREAAVPGASYSMPDGEYSAGTNPLTDDPKGTRMPSNTGPTWVRTNDRAPAVVARDQRFADHDLVRAQIEGRSVAEAAVIGQHGSLGQMVRAMSTSAGSAIVPTVWLGDIVDRARNFSAVIQAGAEIVPMNAKTVQIGRLTGDPAAAFRTEGSTVVASDPTFDNVTLDAKTMSTLVVGSLEWFQDADNADEVVMNAIAKAFALRLDLISLFGGLTTGDEVAADALNETFATPPNPRGVLATLLAQASSSVLGTGAANGTSQTTATFWREVQQTVFQPQAFNEQPNALIWPSKLMQQYVDAYDTTNQPLQMPANIAELHRFVSNQIPAAMTPGTGTNMADLFVGDFRQLLIGQRLDVTIQTLTERYAENGQVGIVAHWRGDIQLARPRAFAVFRNLKAAV